MKARLYRLKVYNSVLSVLASAHENRQIYELYVPSLDIGINMTDGLLYVNEQAQHRYHGADLLGEIDMSDNLEGQLEIFVKLRDEIEASVTQALPHSWALLT